MKYFTGISLFVLLFLSFPTDLEAIVAATSKEVAVESVFELGRTDLLELDKSALQQKIGRKLKFKERIALKIVKRKLRKHANWSGEMAQESAELSGLAIVGFVAGLVSLFFAPILFGMVAIIFSAIALNKTSKNPEMGGKVFAIAGLVLGLIGLFGAMIIGAKM